MSCPSIVCLESKQSTNTDLWNNWHRTSTAASKVSNSLWFLEISYILCLLQRYSILYIQHIIGLGRHFHGNCLFICLMKKGFTWQSERVSFSSDAVCPSSSFSMGVFVAGSGEWGSFYISPATPQDWRGLESCTQGKGGVPGLSLNSVCSQKNEGSGQETQ